MAENCPVPNETVIPADRDPERHDPNGILSASFIILRGQSGEPVVGVEPVPELTIRDIPRTI